MKKKKKKSGDSILGCFFFFGKQDWVLGILLKRVEKTGFSFLEFMLVWFVFVQLFELRRRLIKNKIRDLCFHALFVFLTFIDMVTYSCCWNSINISDLSAFFCSVERFYNPFLVSSLWVYYA